MIWILGAEHCGKRRRKRRDNEQTIILPDDGKTAIYDYNQDQPSFNIKDFPTEKGKTLTQAKTKCENDLKNSEIGKACLKVIVGFDITDLVEQCVTDVQVKKDFINYYNSGADLNLRLATYQNLDKLQ